MASYIVAHSDAVGDGPQPFDPSRHMRQVADLVATVFADELDARGRSALREMQLVGRLSPMLGDTLSMAFFNEYISGQVWIEGGRVVGNVTLQSIDQAGSRWRVSNVAVLPSYRRRGIARTLMLAALREIAQREGNWAVLQVRADNPAAHDLYLDLDFDDVARDAIYRLAAPPLEPDAVEASTQLEPLRSWSGGVLQELAQAARSPLAQWAEPIRSADYRIGFTQMVGEWLGKLTGFHRAERWGVWQEHQLMGAVETIRNAASENATMHFLVRPTVRGKLEQTLVARGLRSLARSGSNPVIVEHDGEHEEGIAALRNAGFRVQRDLITMRRAVRPQDARL